MPSVKAPAIGIDLGTSYSCVGVFQNGTVDIIANDQGNKTTPSCVAFTEHERLMGDRAKAQAVLNPENTVFGVKRVIGRQYEDPRIQSDIRLWPFRVTDDMGRPNIKVTYKGMIKHFHPEEISAMVLTEMKETAEMHLGTKVTDAVISVPAYFNDSQRQATRDAALIAGLNVLRLINEPTAAALAYGLDKNLRGERNILVFDLGGGTFDVTILSINRGSLFEVKATVGDTHLGGEDFDNRMVQYFASEFKRLHGKDIESDPKALLRLRTACERAKRTLSSTSEAAIEVDALYEGIDFYTKITRTKFEELCIDLFRSTLEPVERVLKDAKLDKDGIKDVILIGGSTRIPKIQKMLKDFFNGRELYTSINPDEAVAFGAAVQAAILSGDTSSNIKDVLLVDVAPFSLGVEVAGGVMKRIIERSSRIPCRTSHTFVKYPLDPRGMDISVYEGEKTMTKNNRLLGRFVVTSMSHALKSILQVEVTFDIDADGILHLSAIEKTECFSSCQRIYIIGSKGCLSNEQISAMILEAKHYAEEDRLRRERILARNSLESFLYSVKEAVLESQENELNEKLTVQRICDSILEWLDNNTQVEKSEIDHKTRKALSELSPFRQILNLHVSYQQLNVNTSDSPPAE